MGCCTSCYKAILNELPCRNKYNYKYNWSKIEKLESAPVLTAAQIQHVQSVWKLLAIIEVIPDLELLVFEKMFELDPDIIKIFQDNLDHKCLTGSDIAIDFDKLGKESSIKKSRDEASQDNSSEKCSEKKVQFHRHKRVYSNGDSLVYQIKSVEQIKSRASLQVDEQGALRYPILSEETFKTHCKYVFFYIQSFIDNLDDKEILHGLACQLELDSRHSKIKCITQSHYRLFFTCLDETICFLLESAYPREEHKAVGRFLEMMYYYVTFYFKGLSTCDDLHSIIEHPQRNTENGTNVCAECILGVRNNVGSCRKKDTNTTVPA